VRGQSSSHRLNATFGLNIGEIAMLHFVPLAMTAWSKLYFLELKINVRLNT